MHPAQTVNTLLRIRVIRAIETAHQASQPEDSLMIRAAEATARTAMAMCDGGGRVLVLAGPGNNGGDAWVAARMLQQHWYKVSVLATAEPKAPDAVAARRAFLDAGGLSAGGWPAVKPDLIIDGLLGIGFGSKERGPPAEPLARLIASANQSGSPILALDVPSGLNADTGSRPGVCIRANRTITFIADKPGLHTGEGPDHAGLVEVADLATNLAMTAAENDADKGLLLTQDVPPASLRERRSNTHKGTFGSVGILGAARGTAGAGVLAARAALFSGAGKVYLAPLDEAVGAMDWLHPEIMFRRPRDLLDEKNSVVLVVGPGMGTGDSARSLLEAALKHTGPLVMDADALNLIARGRALQTLLKRRADAGHASILTPHPAEAGRLLGGDTATIGFDRIEAAQSLAGRFSATVVLKGCGTVIACPDHSWAINSTGNPGMAAGGMGDVLSGVLGAVLAQAAEAGLHLFSAVQLAVWAHGKAADNLVASGVGPVGLTPGEVLLACRHVLNHS